MRWNSIKTQGIIRHCSYHIKSVSSEEHRVSDVVWSLFSIRVFFRQWRFTGQQWKGGDHLLFHSTTSTRLRTLRHLQFCMWDDYHVFLIATLVFTRLLLDEIYHLIELPFEWLINDTFVCLLDELILGFWHWKPVDLNLHRLSPLHYKQTN